MKQQIKGATNALYDGDHPSQPPITLSYNPPTVLEPKKVKEVQALVRNYMNNNLHQRYTSNPEMVMKNRVLSVHF